MVLIPLNAFRELVGGSAGQPARAAPRPENSRFPGQCAAFSAT